MAIKYTESTPKVQQKKEGGSMLDLFSTIYFPDLQDSEEIPLVTT